MPESPDCRSIDLYINGEYKGVYLVTEKVEINKNRVNITDLEGDTEDMNPDLDFQPLRPKDLMANIAAILKTASVGMIFPTSLRT